MWCRCARGALSRFLRVWSKGAGGGGSPLGASRRRCSGQQTLDELLERMNTQQQVEPAARLVHRYLTLGHPTDRLFRTLAQALLREDAEFHTFQMLEAAMRQYEQLQGTPRANHVLIAAI